jgi:hypothetical protein
MPAVSKLLTRAGIEHGLRDADVFILFWSANAAASHWVGTELSAYLQRRIEDDTLRIIPMMLDETKLPVLVAHYLGFRITDDNTLQQAAERITGTTTSRERIRRLQERFLELTADLPSNDPLPYVVCPKCGSSNLERYTTHNRRGDDCYCVSCNECTWQAGTEI